jgi:hypothetical protein
MLPDFSKILTFIVSNNCNMNEKLKKLIHLIAMAIALLAVVVFGIIHAMTSMDTQYGTLVMIAYVLMLIWATCRVVILVKEYKELK